MITNGFRNVLFCLAVTGFAALIGCHANADPVCDPGSLTARADRSVNYMPFSEHTETINIRIDGSSKSACRIVLRLASGSDGGLRNRGSRLDVDILTRQERQLISGAGDQFIVTLLPATGKGVSADLMAVIRPRQTVPAGLYEGIFELELVAGGTAQQTATFSLAVMVASQADIRLAGKSGNASGRGVDFGLLESGREETTFVSVRSNSAYAVELESNNGWFLERNGSDSPDERIVYAIWFNGFAVPRQAVARLPQRYEPSGLEGRLNQVRFRIGDVRGKPAGLYQDTVRVTVILLE